MISLIVISIVVSGYAACIALAYFPPPLWIDGSSIETGATVISLSTFSISSILFALMYWVPNRSRLVLSGVRLCQSMALFTFIGPFSLLGYDKLVVKNNLLGDFAVEKAGSGAILGVCISLYFLNKFQKRYIVVHKEEYG